jgi:hypothetical protein
MSDVTVSVETVEEVRSTELSADVLDAQLIGSWSTGPMRAASG